MSIAKTPSGLGNDASAVWPGLSGADRHSRTTGFTHDALNRLSTVDTNLVQYVYKGLYVQDRKLNNDALRLTFKDQNDLDGYDAWGLSPVGNWDDYQVDTDGDGTDDLDQDRTHNLVNEITDITETTGPAWATPVWSARGNMTTAPKPTSLPNTYACKYNSWNRLVEVKDGETVIAKYEYDGLNRRVKVHVDTDAPAAPDGIDAYRHMYYNSSWQLLETRDSATENTEPETLQPVFQYVWSLSYIDAPILRDKNTDQDGLCDDERIYYTTDANLNVTALVKETGESWVVVERYMYTPYGTPIVLNADWSLDSVGGDGVSDYLNGILFGGYYCDWETGLYHVRHRSYHAELGRWLQRDPIGYADGMSLYEYVESAPVDCVDAWGLAPVSDKTHKIPCGKPVKKFFVKTTDCAPKYVNELKALACPTLKMMYAARSDLIRWKSGKIKKNRVARKRLNEAVKKWFLDKATIAGRASKDKRTAARARARVKTVLGSLHDVFDKMRLKLEDSQATHKAFITVVCETNCSPSHEARVKKGIIYLCVKCDETGKESTSPTSGYAYFFNQDRKDRPRPAKHRAGVLFHELLHAKIGWTDQAWYDGTRYFQINRKTKKRYRVDLTTDAKLINPATYEMFAREHYYDIGNPSRR